MIESVHKTGGPVFDDGQRAAKGSGDTKGSGKPTAPKPEAVDDVHSKSPAVSSDKNSIQNPSANTQQGSNPDIKELMEQCQRNSAGDGDIDLNQSELLKKVKEVMERVNASEAALLGVDKLIEHFETKSQFGLGDITTVEKNMKDKNMNQEIGRFSLTRIMEEARKALRGQANMDPGAATRFTEYATGNTADAAEQTNTTEELADQTLNKNFAVSMAEYIAKLDEANHEENSGDAWQDDGILAQMKKHLAATNKVREEEIATERKKKKDEIFYLEEN